MNKTFREIGQSWRLSAGEIQSVVDTLPEHLRGEIKTSAGVIEANEICLSLLKQRNS